MSKYFDIRRVKDYNRIQLEINGNYLDIGYTDRQFIFFPFFTWRKFLTNILMLSIDSEYSNVTIAIVILILSKYHSAKNTAN